jgi:hypothetical protein
MLVISRRPGEAVLIGATIEIDIVEVNGHRLETRCAISVVDDSGADQQLTCKKRPDGSAHVQQLIVDN